MTTPSTAEHETPAAEAHPSLSREYFLVFLVLCGCTVLSVIADMLHLSDKNITRVLVLAIAAAKASCVMLYFMHLKFETSWKYLLLAPTLVLAVSIPVALLSDISLHYYQVDVPQVRALSELPPPAAAAPADH
jgi:cytochrome c oxidase subunit IV